MYPNCTCCTTYSAPADLMDGGVTCAAIEDESIHPERARSLVQERDDAERERARWQESAEAADRERHDWQVRAVKAEDRAGEYHDTIVALRTDLAIALDRAEKERDKATAQLHDALDEQVEIGKERDDALRLAKVAAGQADDALGMVARGECHDCIRDAAVIETMRPMRAEDVTDEMRARARKVAAEQMPYSWWGGIEWWGYADEILTAALTEPQRPEGAEELDALVDLSIRGCSDITSPETVRTIADGLAERGVRVTGAES